MKGREGFGFLLGCDAFEKIKCIFSIAPVESLEKVVGVFLTEKHSPDALTAGTERVSGKRIC